jgi:two-component system chemotaxis response regulator CheB
MPAHDIIVLGASAGGVEALVGVTSTLPEQLPAAVFIVLHIPAQGHNYLARILKRSGPLEALEPVDNMPVEPAHIYVAPPDRHMLVERNKIRVVRGPSENRHRPAIDPLFRSAAQAYGPRVVGVILSGALDDGTAGLLAVKRHGGVAIVQDPGEALYPSMPASALAHVQVDRVLPLAAIGPLLVELANMDAPAEEVDPLTQSMAKETALTEMDIAMMENQEHLGTPSVFSCPECGGVLWEMEDGGLLRFRCRVGHAFSIESVLAEQSDTLESALWVALKTLQESADLLRRLLQQARHRHQRWSVEHFQERLQETEQRIKLIQSVLMKDETLTGESDEV